MEVSPSEPGSLTCIREDAACSACGYSLLGLRGGICPECGRRAEPTAPARQALWSQASRAALAGICLGVTGSALMLATAWLGAGRPGAPARLGLSAVLLGVWACGLWAWARRGRRLMRWSGAAQARLASAVWLALGAATALAVWFEAL